MKKNIYIKNTVPFGIFWILLLAVLSLNTYGRFIKPKQPVNYKELKTPEFTSPHTEVTLVFSYGCPNCYALEKIIKTKWLKKKQLPDSVVLRTIPAFYTIDKNWEDHPWTKRAKLYYVVQYLIDQNYIRIPEISKKNINKYFSHLPQKNTKHLVHYSIFSEYHDKKNSLDNKRAFRKFLNLKFNVTDNQFQEAYESLEVIRQLMENSSTMQTYSLTGVPAIIINRHYVIDQTTAGTVKNVFKTTNDLIKKLTAKKKEITNLYEKPPHISKKHQILLNKKNKIPLS